MADGYPKDKMPGGAMAVMEAPSGKGQMPGEVMEVTEAPADKGKMPGPGMAGTVIEAQPGEGTMPGGTMALLEALSGKGRMPSETIAGAPIKEEPSLGGQYNILMKPGQAPSVAALAGLGPYTRRGSTANFDVFYDNTLGANGQALADAVLANCEWDLFQLRGWFGGVAADRFSVYIDPGSLVVRS